MVFYSYVFGGGGVFPSGATYRDGSWLVHNHKILVHMYDGDLLARHRNLVPETNDAHTYSTPTHAHVAWGGRGAVMCVCVYHV